MTTIVSEIIPVYGPGVPAAACRQGKMLPVDRIEREEARQHVKDGFAIWLKGCNAIQMKKMPAELAIRGASCKVTEPTITANADGVLWAKVIVAGWRGYLHNTLGQPNVVVEYA